jgi:hypothetical protein
MIRLGSIRMTVGFELMEWLWFIRLAHALLLLHPMASVHAQSSSSSSSCISHFQEIYDQEAQVVDIIQYRRYVLCPGQVYVVGQLDYDNEIRLSIESSNPPLPLRSNMNIRCGDDGSSTNLCWIVDGDIQLDGTAMRNIADPALDNVLIEGITFMSSKKHSLLVTKPGSITFQDCEWTVRIFITFVVYCCRMAQRMIKKTNVLLHC